ncbi:hypothetical protein UT4_02920 [Ferrigenium sp. UT4]
MLYCRAVAKVHTFRGLTDMRLSTEQIAAIKQETEHFFGAQAEVWLFGSRVDDAAKGGDVDLYVRSGMRDADQLVRARFAFLAQLKRRIGDGKIDLVLQREGGEVLPIYGIAKQHGVRL